MHRFCLTVLLFSLLASFAGCGDGDAPASSTTVAPAAAPPAPPVAEATGTSPYPSIDVARLEYLFDNATYMDATFYKLPISINQSELPQIRATLSGIAVEPAVLRPGCEPVGHIWFQVNGKNVEEADLYFQPGCTFYVWYENGKPAYSNQLTQDGVGFYQNILNSLPQQ